MLPMKMRCRYLARSDLLHAVGDSWERMGLDLFAVLAPVGRLTAQLALVDCQELDSLIPPLTDCTNKISYTST